MIEFNIILIVIGGSIILIGFFSRFIVNHSIVSISLVSLLIGICFGPELLGWIDPRTWGSPELLFEEASRLTISMSLLGIALRLPDRYITHHWRPLAVMLGIVLPAMAVFSGLVIYSFPGLSFWEAMLVGAVVAPTDPVVASSVVSGKVAEENIPGRIRNLMLAESGANDGLAFPIVFLPLFMLKGNGLQDFGGWAISMVREVAGAAVLGGGLGFLIAWLLNRAGAEKRIEKRFLLGFTMALVLFILGISRLWKLDGVFSVFIAAVIFRRVVEVEEETFTYRRHLQETIILFFNLPVFILLGTALPWQEWLGVGWKGLFIAIGVLLLRRIPAVLVVRPFTKPLKDFRDALLYGWFGPIGISSLFYASIVLRETGRMNVWTFGSLIMALSIAAHGASATVFAKSYGKGRKEKQENS